MKRILAILLVLISLGNPLFGHAGQLYGGDGGAGGSGDVVGPSVSVDNGIARYDGTTGKLIQSYTSNTPTCGDTGICTFMGWVGIGTTPSQQLHLTQNVRIPATTFAAQYGIIYKGADSFIHNFNYGNNGTVTTDGNNTFVGVSAGNFTMGSTATSTGEASGNSAIGTYALSSNTTGHSNSAIGKSALLNNTTGYENSAIGLWAGRYITDGSTPNQTSDTSLYLGAATKSLASGDSNEIVIGYDAIGLGSNTVVLGNSSIVTTQLTGVVLPRTNGASDLGSSTLGFKRLYMDYTNTGTIGAVTINKASFRANIALGATSVVVTNSYVTAASKVLCVAAQNDTTGYVKASVPASGSITIYSPVTTANMAVDCAVINAD